MMTARIPTHGSSSRTDMDFQGHSTLQSKGRYDLFCHGVNSKTLLFMTRRDTSSGEEEEDDHGHTFTKK